MLSFWRQQISVTGLDPQEMYKLKVKFHQDYYYYYYIDDIDVFLTSALLKYWGNVLLWFRFVHKSCILWPSVHNTAHNWQGTIWSWSKPWEAEYSSNCCIFHRLSTVVRADWGLISSEVRPCNILVFSAFSPEICVCSLHAYSAITPASGTVVMSTLVPVNDYCCKE